MYIRENFICGADGSGKYYTVTKSHNCRIKSIDVTDGAKWYSKHLDKEELEKDPELSILFPIIRKTDIDIPFMVKYEYKKAERLNLYCNIPKGSEISVGFFNPAKALDEMQTLYSEPANSPSEAIFAYDCQSRMTIMHNCAKWEAEQFDSTNINGALLSGEIVCRDNKNYFTNFTFGAACLSENENSHIYFKNRVFNDSSVIAQNNSKIPTCRRVIKYQNVTYLRDMAFFKQAFWKIKNVIFAVCTDFALINTIFL